MAANATEEFLNQNNVNQAWKTFISQNERIKPALQTAISEFRKKRRSLGQFYPSDNNILAFLRFSGPQDVKAVITGHDPVPSNDATGIAFSYPDKRWDVWKENDVTPRITAGHMDAIYNHIHDRTLPL